MTIDDLQTALDALSTDRLQRLVDRLEQDPDIKGTVSAWRPRCPMVLAGFEPGDADSNVAERSFATVWDQVAASEPTWWIPLPSAGRTATRSDVQLLLRRANAILACRARRRRPHGRRRDAARHVAQSSGSAS